MLCCLNYLIVSSFCSPQNVPRLFDLVQLKDTKFATAFYYALRDTLVANTLDQATEIAYKVHDNCLHCLAREAVALRLLAVFVEFIRPSVVIKCF